MSKSKSTGADKTPEVLGGKFPMEERELSTLIPYWRNPRRISDDAINAVSQSIKSYGYLQPIAVDEKSVIVIGHTRYMALKRMGVTRVPVIVLDSLTPDQVKRLRVIDNRTSEFSEWDWDALDAELSDLAGAISGSDEATMHALFPEMEKIEAAEAEERQAVSEATSDIRSTGSDGEGGSGADGSGADGSGGEPGGAPETDGWNTPMAGLVCPSCFHEWDQEVRYDEVMAGKMISTPNHGKDA